MDILGDKKILLGLCGSIAVYKVADWIREFKRAGATVEVVMTQSASRFITPLTLAALSGRPVHGDLFRQQGAEAIPHINLGRNRDLILIAPASAQTIARLAHGLADDLLAAVVLAATAPVVVCPAMNCEMFRHPATQANIARLREYGYRIIEPDSGPMACGAEGPGRLPEWPAVTAQLATLWVNQDLNGKKVLVTAGPTHEAIDPVRFIANRSSGKMGYAIAKAAQRRGATVTLISGPTALPTPFGVNRIDVVSAAEMAAAVLDQFPDQDIIIKAAAVADFRPRQQARQKIKKHQAPTEIPLTPNPDILLTVGQRCRELKNPPLLVGFAAESGNPITEGQRKRKEKNLDLLAANDILAKGSGFDVTTNQLTLIDRDGGVEELPLLTKDQAADRLLDRVVVLMRKEGQDS